MNVSQLIKLLQEVQESGHGEAEVRLATQPSYLIAEALRGVVSPDDEVAPRDYDGGQIDASAWEGRPAVVWLVSAGGIASAPYYPPDWVFNAVREPEPAEPTEATEPTAPGEVLLEIRCLPGQLIAWDPNGGTEVAQAWTDEHNDPENAFRAGIRLLAEKVAQNRAYVEGGW